MIALAACGIAAVSLLGGCAGYGPIDQQLAIERSFWKPIKIVPGEKQETNIVGASRISHHGLLPDVSLADRPGHYFFSIPADVTTVRKMTPTESEYLLYAGRLTDTLRPFLTILVARQPQWMYRQQAAFHLKQKRSYVLNNLAATQVSGYYHGKPFIELVLTRFTAGSVIDALAIVNNDRERRTALKILDTMRWIPVARH